jgi:hypothetical protein
VQSADSTSCRRPGVSIPDLIISPSRHSSVTSRRGSDHKLPDASASTTPAAAVAVRDAVGYLASTVSADDPTGVIGTVACPWLISALPGQRINITLFNFVGKL